MSSLPNTYEHMATSNFSQSERLIFAITDDDPATFANLGLPLEEIVNLRFDRMMNVLNFAID